jgi:hypothetical protein
MKEDERTSIGHISRDDLTRFLGQLYLTKRDIHYKVNNESNFRYFGYATAARRLVRFIGASADYGEGNHIIRLF